MALRRLGHEDVAMEYYVAEDQRPLERCLEDVRSADLYVGIFAFRYGYVPPGESRSITELEYLYAKAAGKDCLIFLLENGASWPVDRIEFAAIGEITRLREQLRRDHQAATFATETELVAHLIEATAGWERRRGIDSRHDSDWDAYRAAVVAEHQWVHLAVIAGARHDRLAQIPLRQVFTPQFAVCGLPELDLPEGVVQRRRALFKQDD